MDNRHAARLVRDIARIIQDTERGQYKWTWQGESIRCHRRGITLTVDSDLEIESNGRHRTILRSDSVEILKNAISALFRAASKVADKTLEEDISYFIE